MGMARAKIPPLNPHGVPLHERWTPRRKAEAVAAIHAGRFSRDQLRQALGMSADELDEWERDASRGVGALKRQPIDGRCLSPRHGENG